MAKKAKANPKPRKKRTPDPKAGLREALGQAHEADHEILDALGIKHPHLPLVGAAEMLKHLLDLHVTKRS